MILIAEGMHAIYAVPLSMIFDLCCVCGAEIGAGISIDRLQVYIHTYSANSSRKTFYVTLPSLV